MGELRIHLRRMFLSHISPLSFILTLLALGIKTELILSVGLRISQTGIVIKETYVTEHLMGMECYNVVQHIVSLELMKVDLSMDMPAGMEFGWAPRGLFMQVDG